MTKREEEFVDANIDMTFTFDSPVSDQYIRHLEEIADKYDELVKANADKSTTDEQNDD